MVTERIWFLSLLVFFVTMPVDASDEQDPALCSLNQQRVAEAFYSLSDRWQRAHQPLLSLRFVEDLELSREYCIETSVLASRSLLCNEVSRLLSGSSRFLQAQWAYRREGQEYVQTSLYGLYLNKQRDYCEAFRVSFNVLPVRGSAELFADNFSGGSLVRKKPLLTETTAPQFSWLPVQVSGLGTFSGGISGSWQLAYRKQD